jgi:hypothetical protein
MASRLEAICERIVAISRSLDVVKTLLRIE